MQMTSVSHNELEGNLKHVQFKVVPTILMMSDLALRNTHGHENYFVLQVLLTFNELQKKTFRASFAFELKQN